MYKKGVEHPSEEFGFKRVEGRAQDKLMIIYGKVVHQRGDRSMHNLWWLSMVLLE